MKNTKRILAATLVFVGAWSQAQADVVSSKTTETVVNVSTARLVSGYDPAEPVAVLSGTFPNSCYSWNRADVANVSETLHEIRAIANVRRGMCLMVLVPFSEEVQVGRLSRGTHTLRFMNGDGTYQEQQVIVDR